MSGLKTEPILKFCTNRIAELERDDLIHPSQKAFGIREAKRMIKFVNEQASEDGSPKEADIFQNVSQQRELLIALLIENIDTFVPDDNFLKMSNSYKKLKAIYSG